MVLVQPQCHVGSAECARGDILRKKGCLQVVVRAVGEAPVVGEVAAVGEAAVRYQ